MYKMLIWCEVFDVSANEREPVSGEQEYSDTLRRSQMGCNCWPCNLIPCQFIGCKGEIPLS